DLNKFNEEHETPSPWSLLSFGAFVNALVILALQVCRTYRDPSEANQWSKPSEALDQLMSLAILPWACKDQGILCGDQVKTLEIGCYLQPTYHFYKFLTNLRHKNGRTLPTMTMREFVICLRDLQLTDDALSISDIVSILCAKNPLAGPYKECNIDYELTFFDFFEALIHCALAFIRNEVATYEEVTKAVFEDTNKGGGDDPIHSEQPPEKRKEPTHPSSPVTTSYPTLEPLSQKKRPSTSAAEPSDRSNGTYNKTASKKGKKVKRTKSIESSANASYVKENGEQTEVQVEEEHSGTTDPRQMDKDTKQSPVNIVEESGYLRERVHQFFKERFFPATQHFEATYKIVLKKKENQGFNLQN
ncbi:unnamed protein product, partial [Dicrocoelium dendriticum]